MFKRQKYDFIGCKDKNLIFAPVFLTKLLKYGKSKYNYLGIICFRREAVFE